MLDCCTDEPESDPKEVFPDKSLSLNPEYFVHFGMHLSMIRQHNVLKNQ